MERLNKEREMCSKRIGGGMKAEILAKERRGEGERQRGEKFRQERWSLKKERKWVTT